MHLLLSSSRKGTWTELGTALQGSLLGTEHTARQCSALQALQRTQASRGHSLRTLESRYDLIRQIFMINMVHSLANG